MPQASCVCGKKYSYKTRRGTFGPCCREKQKKASGARHRSKHNWRQIHLWSRYRITNEQFQEILTEQGGGCAICGAPDTPENKLSVDHCHRTNVIRGILCFSCNRGIGSLQDDPQLLQAALDYLELGVVSIPIVKIPGARQRVKGGVSNSPGR